ncbi:MAG: glycosyltransferase family 4 protein [Pirellulales bacterium]
MSPHAGTAGAGSRRIAICLSHFHPTVGGAERQLFQLAQCWAGWGHAPLVLTRHVPGLPTHEMVSGIEIRRVIRTLDAGPMFGMSFLVLLAANLLRFTRRYDVVLAAQAPWEAVATGLVAHRLGKPSIVRIASVGPAGDLAQIRRAKGRALLRRLVLRNSCFLAPSAQARAELAALGCSGHSIRSISNGVDIDRFSPPPAAARPPDEARSRTALFVGRLTDLKNPLAVLRAWRHVERRGEHRLLVAGDGPLRESLQAYCRQEKLASVEFLGQADDMPAVYRRAAVLVQPSPNEGCSNALLEAMACGLCPIVSRVPGNLDVVQHDVTGLTITLNDDASLAAALLRSLDDAALRTRLAEAARRHVVSHHSLERVARQYLELFDELLAARS